MSFTRAFFSSWLFIVFANMFGFVAILFLVEGVLFHALELPRPNYLRHISQSEIAVEDYHESIGHWLKSNLTNIEIFRVNLNSAQVILDFQYSTDSAGRRVTVPFHSDGKWSALFFGGSWAFGHGLSDKETVASRFSELQANAQVFNYGRSNTGLNEAHRLLETGFVKPPPTDSGYVFYLMIRDHLFRSVPNFDINRETPIYEIENNEPVYRGRLNEVSGSLLWTESFMNSFLLTRWLGLLHRRPFLAKDDQLFCELLKSTSEKTQQLGKDFQLATIVLDSLESSESKQLQSCAKKHDLTIWNFHEWTKVYSEPLTLPGDSHPNSRFNEFLARFITKQMELPHR